MSCFFCGNLWRSASSLQTKRKKKKLNYCGKILHRLVNYICIYSRYKPHHQPKTQTNGVIVKKTKYSSFPFFSKFTTSNYWQLFDSFCFHDLFSSCQIHIWKTCQKPTLFTSITNASSANR